MALPQMFWIVTLLMGVTFVLVACVYAGGVRYASHAAAMRRYRRAQARFVELRRRIREHNRRKIEELHAEIDESLLRLREARAQLVGESRASAHGPGSETEREASRPPSERGDRLASGRRPDEFTRRVRRMLRSQGS